MGFLTGGRQTRNVGIGVVDALIKSGNVPEPMRPVVDTVLWNQLIYVAKHGELGREHERHNAERLIRYIEEIADTSKILNYSSGEMDNIRGLVQTANRTKPAGPSQQDHRQET